MSKHPRTDDQRIIARNLKWNIECVWEWAQQLERELAAMREPPADVVPSAWLITSKRGLVRCAITTAPTQDHINCAECDGDTITPLYAHPAAVPADVAGLVKRNRDDYMLVMNALEGRVPFGDATVRATLAVGRMMRDADALTALAQQRDRLADDKCDLHRVCLAVQEREAEGLRKIITLEAQLEQSAFLLRDEQNRRVAAQDELAEVRRDAGRYQCYRVQNPPPPSIAFATPEQRDAFYDAAIQEGMSYKVTRKDEAYFEQRVMHWANVLSLGDWRIEVWSSTKVTENSAECEMWHNAHGAHIKLRGVFDHKPDAKFLNQLALHEVCHVLLCDLKRLIKELGTTDAQAETAEHAVIRRLERAFIAAARGK